MHTETKAMAGESSVLTSPGGLSCSQVQNSHLSSGMTWESVSGGYVREQQVWHHTSISGGAKDCDLEQVTSPDVKVQTSLCKEEL